MTDSVADPSGYRAGLGRRSLLRAGALAGAAVGAGAVSYTNLTLPAKGLL